MYSELGDVEGYATAGRSFLDAGFEGEALEAFRKAERAGSRRRGRRRSKRLLSHLDEVRSRIEELERTLSA